MQPKMIPQGTENAQHLHLIKGKNHKAFDRIVTSGGDLQKVFHVIERVAPTQATVLILGESGTGKELIARAIHDLSACSGAFVPVNCAAIPDNLLESELFGYEKGAFTGAVGSKPGRFQLADNGTIFLDEIGEMTPQLQVKLLRVLQSKIVEPVGGTKSREVNVRVVAATNANLREKVRTGQFREDLFYRLQVVPIELPPLRTRTDDIPILADYFSGVFASQMGIEPLRFTEEVADTFRRYNWPGNVRELENLVERLAILADECTVSLADLPPHMLETSGTATISGATPTLPESGVDFNLLVEEFENSLITQALERTSGNKKAAADLLGLNRTTLVEKIKKKGLENLSDARLLD